MNFEAYNSYDLLRMLLLGEAEGEGVVGMIAVALVVRNQLNDGQQRFGKSWKEVILHPLRYSCFNEGSVRIADMVKLITQYRPRPLYRQISWIMTGIINSSIADDITNGANHYITKELYEGENCPEWARRCTVTARIGNHVFLKE